MSLVKCPECGSEISNQATTCPRCGASLANENVAEKSEMNELDNVLDMPWLSFIFPPVGIILYFVRRNEAPKKAKTLLIAALLGLAAELCSFIFWSIVS